MNGNLPWTLIFIGAFISITVEILGVAALPVSIGLYLPLELSSTIMLGGLIKLYVDKKFGAEKDESGKGILFCSGLIAGEGIIGVLLAVLKVFNITEKMDLSAVIPTGNIQACILIVIVSAAVLKSAIGNRK